MTIHTECIKPEHFQPILDGKTNAVLLFSDRKYREGDFIFFREFSTVGSHPATDVFLGACAAGVVTHVSNVSELKPGSVMRSVLLSFDRLFVYSNAIINWGISRADLYKLDIYPDFLEQLFSAYPHSPVFYALTRRLFNEVDL
ncbi:DUF3850 domain-containing protein [Salmonella enterica subsp. enterica]|nr:DUF3850 domain-containing protein [Salmonella enterica subsp. enterica]EEA8731929.1 DUF3850 domain-containing protein [Salmonella enterica subsp. enterica serovar Agbeni]MIL24638.1 DUF3850 domain-containing protein [Salmonella enterica]MLP05862.1 hypothetical protein [Salmonella enterica subsp. enterica serovar Kedougou]